MKAFYRKNSHELKAAFDITKIISKLTCFAAVMNDQ